MMEKENFNLERTLEDNRNAYIVKLANAKKKSVNNNKIKVNINKRKIKQSFAAGALAALIAMTTIGVVGLSSVETRLVSNMNNAESAIVSMIYNDNEEMGIVARNTKRTINNDGYYYDNFGIAKDIVTLSNSNDELFNDVLYVVYSEMQENGEKNIDDVYNNLYNIVSDKKDNFENLSNKLADSTSLDAYLVKEHFVDENGKASFEKLRENYLKNIRVYDNYYKSHAKNV